MIKKLIKAKDQSGFVMIEVLMAIAISALILVGIVDITVQTVIVNASDTNQMRAIKQVENAIHWIERDALDDFENLKGGIIAGINPFGFFTENRKVKANLYKGGLISRFLVASYSISNEMKSKIFDSITRGEYRTDTPRRRTR